MAITFAIIVAVMGIITALKPLAQPKELPVREDIDMTTSKSTVWLGLTVVAAVLLLYIVFW